MKGPVQGVATKGGKRAGPEGPGRARLFGEISNTVEPRLGIA